MVFMLMSVMWAMGCTGFTRILNVPAKEGFGHQPHIPGASPVYRNAVTLEYLNGSLPHIAGEHHRNPHPAKNSGNVTLTAATLRRRNGFFMIHLI
jgi:hypothetical protein